MFLIYTETFKEGGGGGGAGGAGGGPHGPIKSATEYFRK